MYDNISMESFGDWLLKELKDRNMTQTELARQAGLGTGTISNIMIGNRKVGQSTLVKIADALHIPQEEVFRAAGVIKAESIIDRWLNKRFEEVIKDLPDDDVENLYNLALSMIERNKRKKK